MAARLGLHVEPVAAAGLSDYLAAADPCGLLVAPGPLSAGAAAALAQDPLLPVWLAGALEKGALPPRQLLEHPGFDGALGSSAARGSAPRLTRGVCRYLTHRRIAERDQLTGLPNRAGFARWLVRARAGAPDQPWRVFLIDLCDLKATNRRDGYAAGDRRIAAAAQALVAQIEAGAPRGRWGGDELIAAVTRPIARPPEQCRIASAALGAVCPPLASLVDRLHRALGSHGGEVPGWP